MKPINRPTILLPTVALMTLGSACVYQTEVDFEVSAALEVDLAAADAPAELDVTIEFEAGSEAYATVSLARVAIYETETTMLGAEPLLTLELGLPESFDPELEPGQDRAVTLENLGTTNADFAGLESYCGSSVDLLVDVDFDALDGNEPGVDGTTLVMPVPLACS